MTVQITDAIAGAATVAAAAGTAPLYYDLMEPVTTGAGPLTSILMELVVPSIFLGVVISLGASALREEGR